MLASERNLARWDWVKWLPHALSARRSDAVGRSGWCPPRSSAWPTCSLPTLPTVLGSAPANTSDPARPARHRRRRRRRPTGSWHGVTLLDLPARWDELDDPTTLRLRLEGEPAADRRPRCSRCVLGISPSRPGRPVPPVTAEALARRLTPLRAGDSGRGATGAVGLPGLLGVCDLRTLDPPTAWRRPRSARDRLRVPIGHTEDGAVVHLDLKESAQQAWDRTGW